MESIDRHIKESGNLTRYEISPELKKKVSVCQRNIATDEIPEHAGKYHIVFAEGVCFYLRNPQDVLEKKVIPAMEATSYLFSDMGLLDSQNGVDDALFQRIGNHHSLSKREQAFAPVLSQGDLRQKSF